MQEQFNEETVKRENHSADESLLALSSLELMTRFEHILFQLLWQILNKKLITRLHRKQIRCCPHTTFSYLAPQQKKKNIISPTFIFTLYICVTYIHKYTNISYLHFYLVSIVFNFKSHTFPSPATVNSFLSITSRDPG